MLLYSFSLFGIEVDRKGNESVVFIENKGQWHENVRYKLELNNGALFFESDRVTWHMVDPQIAESNLGRDNHNHGHAPNEQNQSFAFQSVFLGAKDNPLTEGQNPRNDYRNYLLGNNPDHWASHVMLYQQLNYHQVYDGIDAVYYGKGDFLKYDWIVHPNATPEKIKTSYSDNVKLYLVNGELIIDAPTGKIKELRPYAYQIIDGQKQHVSCQFVLEGQVVSFKLGNYNRQLPLIIDPQVVFSSYSGSTADNWGFTATYDLNENLYAGGIVFDIGYPVTANNVQGTFNARPDPMEETADIGISVFDPTGANLKFSTYLGGTDYDHPQSMIVNSLGELVIFGTTGSKDFPIPENAYDTTHHGGPSKDMNGYDIYNGADIYVVKLNANGDSITGGTFMGGTGTDGANYGIFKNYGDVARGEVVLDQNDNIYVAGSTNSIDFPVTTGASQTTIAGGQDAVVFKLNASLTTLLWSTYYGGANHDAGYSLKVNKNGDVYLCGGTLSSDLPKTSGAYKASAPGSTDGYVARFNPISGALKRTTYLGTSDYDQAFILDHDKFGNIYVFGQSRGTYPVIGTVYSNTYGGQFIQKLSADLSKSDMSTVFGSGGKQINIVPTAFNIDECLNILLSGWGGVVNSQNPNHNGGNTHNMPITNDAYQSSTDGSDFYFMVLKKNASSLEYASYFGGNSQEHVDGGTSRFHPQGVIYQAVCAGCGNLTFPTTPNAYSQTNGSTNCNLGVIKIDFDVFIKANASIDWKVNVDTSCNTLIVKFNNLSQSTHSYEWDFGNGHTSTQMEPTAYFDTLGTYTIQLIAYDTICDLIDTTTLTFTHDQGVYPKAAFKSEYTPCDIKRIAKFNNTSSVEATAFKWYFGDGSSSTLRDPNHTFPGPGTYSVSLVAIDTTCGNSDSTFQEVSFNYTIPSPIVEVSAAECGDGSLDISYQNDSSWYQYEWVYSDGKRAYGKYPNHRFSSTGTHQITVIITDTLCNTTFQQDFELYMIISEDRLFIPNAFTPNGDQNNELFVISGNTCMTGTSFVILNSYGAVIFETKDPFNDFWDGKINGKPAQEDVYVYRFTSDLANKTGFIVLYY